MARYTSAAAPMYFTEMDNYIDGGFLANNPSQAAWSEMYQHLQPGEELKPSLIVSLGTGTPPDDDLKPVSLNPTRLPKFLELLELLVSYPYSRMA